MNRDTRGIDAAIIGVDSIVIIAGVVVIEI